MKCEVGGSRIWSGGTNPSRQPIFLLYIFFLKGHYKCDLIRDAASDDFLFG
jgi:hypothetical protein